MFKNTRVFSGFLVFFWSTLILELILMELTNLTFLTLLIPLIISTIGTAVMLFLFIRSYYKSKQNVTNLKHEYLESLKPKTPLRFCASDDELLKAYKESASELSSATTTFQQLQNKQLNSSTNKNTNADEELTM